MKILVIGNGFDLYHKLPTSYKNFLNFCEYLLKKGRVITGDDLENLVTDKQQSFYKRLECDNRLEKYVGFLENNKLILYFIEKSKGVNWIDFESEIKYIVDIFSDLEQEFFNNKMNKYEFSFSHQAVDLCHKMGLKVFFEPSDDCCAIVDDTSLKVLYKTLFSYLEKLSKVLELYIFEFINKEILNTFSPDIVEFNPNRIISFNYSDTFERLYLSTSLAKNVDYIHGKANSLSESDKQSNIVLGITSNKTVESNYVSFEKYYQRITKRTGAQYKEWIKNTNEQLDIMFFGHSLDSADKDILIDLIEHKNSFVKIVYYDDKAYKTIVENLNVVLGKEKLISYVYGNQPKIIFIKQQPACDKTSIGWEITHDIANINNLQLLSNTDTEAFIRKIENKINQRDTKYFYSQKSLISFYDALSKQKLDNLLAAETAITIAQGLDFEISNGLLVEYDISSWTMIDQFNEKDYSVSTKRLIDKINTINKVRFQDMSKQSIAALISKLENKKEKDNNITSVLYAIITDPMLFENKTNLNYLVSICQDNDTIINTLRELEKDNTLEIGYIIKIRNVIKEYEQHQYYLERTKAKEDEGIDWVAQSF